MKYEDIKNVSMNTTNHSFLEPFPPSTSRSPTSSFFFPQSLKLSVSHVGPSSLSHPQGEMLYFSDLLSFPSVLIPWVVSTNPAALNTICALMVPKCFLQLCVPLHLHSRIDSTNIPGCLEVNQTSKM